ncbi:helix-turn-helix transcriptional regulator [Mycolicibacterium stellerae]|uniref:helix-turn-helix transcriptional regulator n=1 Tax=Mycolicibacterium stellerae TaxID=2358193 RepID=UPI0013DE618C|nr:LuxR family transcriptional regulator [Mycolicibacterium stellerae]
MSTPIPTGPDAAGPIIGRDELIEATVGVATGAAGAPTACALLGPIGIGKSTLLRNAMASVPEGEFRVLFAAGGAAATTQPYGLLSQLMWPIVDFAEALPLPLRNTVSEVLGPAATASGRGPVVVHQAVLALFDAAARTTPILLAVDDVDAADEPSRDALAYVIDRLFSMPARALLTARRNDLPRGLDRTVQMVEVPPLPDHSAALLLDAQPRPPGLSVRGELIRWAEGNPLALIESARACGRSGATTFPIQGIAGPGGAFGQFVGRLADLPPDCRTLVHHAAAGTGHESIDAITEAAGFGDDLARWEPATSAGLLTVTDDRRVRFDHPLIRTAAYADGTLQRRCATHQALAVTPRLDPHLRAWHTAAARSDPDEPTAAALEEAAASATGGHLEAARRLQRAAELSPGRDDEARRYGLAAAAANFAGDPAWALALSERAAHGTDDADVRGHAALTQASILLQSAHPVETISLIQTVLDDPTTPQGNLVLDLGCLAASASYYSGEPSHRRLLHRWLARAARQPSTTSHRPAPFPPGSADLQRAYIRLYADIPDAGHGRPAGLDERLTQPGPAAVEPYRRLVAGLAAYVTEDSVPAARDLTKAIELLTQRGQRGFSYAMAPLAWALLDTGRWTTLSKLLDETAAVPAIAQLRLLDTETWACRAQLLAYRGDRQGAQHALDRARRESSPAGDSRATEVALTRAAAWRAVCVGDFETAHHGFRQMFGTEGRPAHFVVSYRAIADLAWSAARSGRTDETRPLIAAIAAQLGSDPPVRLALLRHQAMALVAATPQEAERHHRLACLDPAGDDWPLERARARLHYGEWLRRARRAAEARTLLTAALDVFQRLGALPLAEIANAELRAAGISAASAPASDAFDALTAQQRQIAMLAASGLTNRQIGDRLNLSPRTIGSHLYQVYPKLGISRRHELRVLGRQEPVAVR